MADNNQQQQPPPGIFPQVAGNPQAALGGAQQTLGASSGPLLQMAQQAMSNPMGQGVPPGGGQIDPSQHPLIAGLIRALSQGAQSYGWTAMQPQERVERTQMQQQKAETLANLAGTQAYREGMLGYRGGELGVSQERADTGAAAQQSQADYRKFQEQNASDKLDLAKAANTWKQAIAQGRLGLAQQTIDQKASQFEQKFTLASKNFGLEQAKLELAQEGLGIKSGFLELAKTALAQKGTEEGVQTLTKLQQLQIEHPILSSIFGLDDVNDMVKQAGQTALPGVAPVQPQPAGTPTGVPSTGTPPTNPPAPPRGMPGDPLGLFGSTPAATGKANAKTKQRGQ